MLIEHDRAKLLNSIIYFLSNTKSCGKTKLFKLLYYLDFMHFRETGRSVTNLDYYAWNFYEKRRQTHYLRAEGGRWRERGIARCDIIESNL